MKIFNKILHSYAIYCRKQMVKILNVISFQKSYDTLSKGAIFFWPTLYYIACLHDQNRSGFFGGPAFIQPNRTICKIFKNL